MSITIKLNFTKWRPYTKKNYKLLFLLTHKIKIITVYAVKLCRQYFLDINKNIILL